MANTAETIFFKNTPLIGHNGNDDLTPAYDYLLELIDSKHQPLLKRLFTEDGFFKERQVLEIDPYSLSTSELINLLAKRLMPIYKLVNPSLDSAYNQGFNRHDWQHILEVGAVAEQILDALEIDKESPSYKNVVIAVLGHDLGNLLSRKYHHELSPAMLGRAVPELLIDPARFARLKETIELHDESKLNKQIQDIANVDDQINYLSSDIFQEALILFLADKCRMVGRSRVTAKSVVDSSAIEQDPHLLLSLCFASQGLSFSIDNESNYNQPTSSVIWQIEFNRALSSEEEKNPKINRFQTEDKPKVMVPERIHHLHHQYGIPHSFSLWAEFMQTNFPKVSLMAKSSLALFPESQEFKIKMTDRANGYDGGTVITEQFNRQSLRPVLEQLNTKYGKR